jgi:perosamine synthetase
MKPTKYAGKELHYIQRMMEGFDFDDWVRVFEQKFSDKIGGKHCIAVNSGTSALHTALVACGVKGGEVLVPALTPAMVIFAIIHAGATPVFCDVDPNTHHISEESMRENMHGDIRAILGVSLHGLPMDWTKLPLALKGKPTIDDCAQALGAKGIGKADITCFSFEDKKHITTGSEGGMIMTDNEELAIKARKFAGLGYKHMTAEAGRTTLSAETYQDPDYERFDTIGLNYRMSKVQAAIGLAQLERLDHIIAMRKAVARMYIEAIDAIPKQTGHSYYTFPFSLKNGNWKDFYKRFKANGGDGFYAEPLVPYREPALQYLYKGMMEICPIAEDLQKRLMLFKTNYRDLGEAERQAEILRKTLGN